jgi:peroxiredoxin
MRRVLRILILVVAPLVAAVPARAAVGKGQKAPNFTLPSLRGGNVAFSSFAGKVVLLDFWAQWCEPCKRELPELEKLAREFAGRNVVVVGVNIDKLRDNAARFAQQLGLTFPVLLDPAGNVASTYELPKMPSSFLVDKKGVVRFVHEGFDGGGDVARFRKELEELTH